MLFRKAMSANLKRNAPALIRLAKSRKRFTKQQIRDCCTPDFTKAVGECCWNVLYGRVPLTAVQKRRLSPHKALVRKLSNSNTSIKTRQRALQQTGGFGGFIRALFKPLVTKILVPIAKTVIGDL